MTSKELDKYIETIRSLTKMCSCGRRVYVDRNKDYGICDWCGKAVYRTKQIKFKAKLKRKMKEVK